MKNAVRRLAALEGALAALGLFATLSEACAAGSEETDADTGNNPVVDAAPNRDVAAEGSSGDAGRIDDSSVRDVLIQPDSEGPIDAVSDASPDVIVDATSDTGADVVIDSGPRAVFGATCPSGTVYNEPLLTDPVVSGSFISLIGPYTHNATLRTLSLATGNPNTQLWIGARPSWTNYTISVPVRIDSANANGNGGITFRMVSTPPSPANNAGQMYFAGIAMNKALLGIENGDWTEFVGPAGTFNAGTFYTLQIKASGTSFTISIDGTAYITNYVEGTYTVGSFGLRTYASAMTFGPMTVTCN